MNRIAIVTDSNSGITQEQADELNVFLQAMPVLIDGDSFFEGVDMNCNKFYEMLTEDTNVSTSQPSPADIAELWTDLLKDYESIVYIPMSSSLSKSYETSYLLAREFDDRVHVVNNQRISVSQKESVLDAIELKRLGMSAEEIKEILEEDKFNSSIYITVDSLKFLKKGGRITPAAAAVGSLLKIKPVLQIQGGLLDSFAKARTMKIAKKIMIDALKRDLESRFSSESGKDDIILKIAYTNNEEEAMELKKDIEAIFPDYPVQVDQLPLSIVCHTGPGAIGIGCIKKLRVLSMV